MRNTSYHHHKDCGTSGCVYECPLRVNAAPRKRKTKKRESQIEKEFVRVQENEGHWVPKFVSPGTPGVPDRIVLRGLDAATRYLLRRVPLHERDAREIVAGVVESAIRFVELKTPKGKLRARQKRVHKRLRKMGYRVDVVRE